jgi:hypothetical protein
MLVLVGKATPHPTNGDIEIYQRQFENILAKTGYFAYGWSFNPDDMAMDALKRAMGEGGADLYLPEKGGFSRLKVHIVDYHHTRASAGCACPDKWDRYCIGELKMTPRGLHNAIRLWLLIDDMFPVSPPVNLRTAFRPLFDKYQKWGQNCFAFLEG